LLWLWIQGWGCDIPHLIARGLSQCICSQPINFTWINLFCYVHGGKHITTHDVVSNFFASIVRDVKFHVLHKQIHVLSMLFL
jgi:hypothetical protein